MKLSDFIREFHYTNNGIGENTPIEKINKEQLLVGIAVEMEHTDDLNMSASIAIDHLTENKDYYTILLQSGLVDEKKALQLGKELLNIDAMEKEAGVETGDQEDTPHVSGAYLEDGMPGERDRNGHPIPAIDPNFSKMELEPAGDKDNELSDELLGYKPHNVQDYATEEMDYAAREKDYWNKEYHKQDQEKEHPLADILDTDGTEDDLSKQNTGEKGVNRALEGQNLAEEDGFDEYAGDIGDRYQDGEGNQFTVRDKVNGGVTLQGQGGEKEIATRDIGFLKKLSEEKVVKKEIITEEQIKTARQALNKRGLNEGMTKKEAVRILIKHNIR